MTRKNTGGYVFTGQGQLLLKCLKEAVAGGITISAVVSTDPNILAWTHKHEITSMHCHEQLVTDELVLEWLISINCKSVIPVEVLERVNKYAINYHNSFLPKYAGVHSCSWAILNGEKSHGITWHILTEKLDTGDILYQSEILVEPNDTAYTLELKCEKLALASFDTLLHKLVNGDTLNLQQQDLSSRDYYAYGDKPKNLGFINWTEPASVIYKQFRAMTLKSMPNSFCSIKFCHKENIFVVVDMNQESSRGEVAPGTILCASSTRLLVATPTNDIAIRGVWHPELGTLSIADLVEQFNVNAGDRLKNGGDVQLTDFVSKSGILEKDREWLNTIASTVIKSSDYLMDWQKAFANDERVIFDLPAFNSNAFALNELIATVLIYLLHTTTFELVNAFYSDDRLSMFERESGGYVCSHIPLVNPALAEMSIDELIKATKSLIDKCSTALPYQKDLLARIPDMISPVAPDVLLYIGDPKLASENVRTKLTVSVNPKCMSVTVSIPKAILVEHPKLQVELTQSLANIATQVTQEPGKLLRNVYLLTQGQYHHEDIAETYEPVPNKNVASELVNVFTRNKDDVAFTYKGESIKYSTLVVEVDKILEHFRSSMLDSESKVAVILPRCPEQIYLAVACLRAGVAYMPLDSNYPTSYLQSILERHNPNYIIVSNNEAVERLSGLSHNVISINELKAACSNTHHTASVLPSGKDTAYIIHTSGSTSQPKAVSISHDNLDYSITQRLNYYGKAEQVILNLSPAFDVSMAAIFWTLLSGGTLNIVPETKNIIFETVDALKVSHDATLFTTPSAYHRILSTLACGHERVHLKRVIIGAENSTQSLFELHKSELKTTDLYNEYGLTECTIWSSVQKIYDGSTHLLSRLSLGCPLPGTTFSVKNSYDKLLPSYCLGELHIHGAGVTKALAGAELNTHDLVKINSNGHPVFIKRADKQVDVNGVRVSLPDIESHILKFPGVIQVKVMYEASSGLNKTLLAFIVTELSNNNFETEKLRLYLSQSLPVIMIPSSIIHIDAMPMTINNKIDAKQLLATYEKNREINSIADSNVSPMKRKVRELMATALNRSITSESQSFFELGGNSLEFVDFINLLEKHYKIEIRVNYILEHSSVDQVCHYLSGTITTFSPVRSEQTDHLVLIDKINHLNPLEKVSTYKSGILLTGVTGFLGLNLLKKLLICSQAKIYCLVRDKSRAKAEKRLWTLAAQNGISRIAHESRVEVFVGDLEQPNLGLNDSDYDVLSEQVGKICHAGAVVNHLYDYSRLRSANVLSTYELIKLTTVGVPKFIYYISSLSAISHQPEVIRSDGFSEFHGILQSLSNGYSKSKYLSEAILKHAQYAIGTPCFILRASWVMPDLGDKVFPENNYLLLLMEACFEIGYIPSFDEDIYFHSVDYVCSLVARDLLSERLLAQTYNLLDESMITWQRIMELMCLKAPNLQVVDTSEWERFLSEHTRYNSKFSVLKLLLEKNGTILSSPATSDISMTKGMVKEVEVPRWTTKVDELFRRYINYAYSESLQLKELAEA